MNSNNNNNSIILILTITPFQKKYWLGILANISERVKNLMPIIGSKYFTYKKNLIVVSLIIKVKYYQ
jgi:hypothetical protein